MIEHLQDKTCPAVETAPVYPPQPLKEATLYIRIRLKERSDKTIESNVTQFEVANFDGLMTNLPALIGDFDTRYNLEKLCEVAVKHCS